MYVCVLFFRLSLRCVWLETFPINVVVIVQQVANRQKEAERQQQLLKRNAFVVREIEMHLSNFSWVFKGVCRINQLQYKKSKEMEREKEFRVKNYTLSMQYVYMYMQ